MKTKCGDKQWEPSQCPLARALISTLSNVSISGLQPIHSTPKPTPDHIAGGGGWGTRARPRWKQTQIEKQGGRGSSATRSLPTNMWTKTFKKSACKKNNNNKINKKKVGVHVLPII